MLANKIFNSIHPKIIPDPYIVNYKDKSLVLIRIHPGADKPYYVVRSKQKDVYVRCGSTTQKADEHVMNSIRRSTQRSFDKELCMDSSEEDIDTGVATRLLSTSSIIKDLSINQYISFGFFVKERNRIVPTRGGIILFGKNRLDRFPSAQIRVTVFAGNQRDSNATHDNCIKSFLPYAIDKALSIIEQNLSVELRFAGARHAKILEIPEVALREAVINSVVHNDYCLYDPIRIAIFRDRVEIENNAIFLGGLVLNDLGNSVSQIHNHVIARFFREIGLVEEYGSGIIKILTACKNAGLKEPKFEVIKQRLRVTFFKDKDDNSIIDDIDKFIISLIVLRESLSTHQIAACLGKGKRYTINRLNLLTEKGWLISIGTSPNDPKRVYSVRKTNTLKDKSIVDAWWDPGMGALYIFMVLGNYRINILLRQEDVDDFFMDDSSNNEEGAITTVKKSILSEKVMQLAILDGIADEKVQRSLKEGKGASILLVPYHLLPYEDRALESMKRNYSADTCAPFPVQSSYGFRKR